MPEAIRAVRRLMAAVSLVRLLDRLPDLIQRRRLSQLDAVAWALDDHRRLGWELQLGDEVRVGLDLLLHLRLVEVALPLLDVELDDPVRDLLQELVGDALGDRFVLVAEEELDELPLMALQAGGDSSIGRDAGVAGAGGEMMELELDLVGSDLVLDQRVDRVSLIVRAVRALEIVEDLDRHRRVVVPQPSLQLGDAADEPLDLTRP